MSQSLPRATDSLPGGTEDISGGTAPGPAGASHEPHVSHESHVRREDLERLVANNLPQLREFVRRRAGARILTRESPSDVVQSACREVLEAADGIRWQGEAAFRSFLYTTTLRKLIDKQRFHARRKRRMSAEVPLVADELDDPARVDRGTPSQCAVRAESLDRLQQELDRLPPEQRDLISMRRLFGLTTEEIAAELGISSGAVRARLSRAIARLAAQMKHI